MMLILSISIWVVLVYSLKVCYSGNAAYDLVKEAPTLVLNQAADCLESELMPENENICLFIKMFFRLTALACALFLLEFGIVLYFIFSDPTLPIPWLILSKNFLMLWVGYSLHRKGTDNIFESVQNLPAWAMRWERISYLITAVCFLYLFLTVNNLIP